MSNADHVFYILLYLRSVQELEWSDDPQRQALPQRTRLRDVYAVCLIGLLLERRMGGRYVVAIFQPFGSLTQRIDYIGPATTGNIVGSARLAEFKYEQGIVADAVGGAEGLEVPSGA